jgi:hypothetical protein
MMLTIHQDTVAALGFDLGAAIDDYRAALTAHATTEGIPAPTAHPLVERVVKGHGGAYQIVEPETGVKTGDPESLASRVQALADQVNALKSILLGKSVITLADLTAKAITNPVKLD